MKSYIFLFTLAIAVSASPINISAQHAGNDQFSTIEHSMARINIDTNHMVAVAYQCLFENDRRRLVVRVFDEAGYLVYFCNLRKQGRAQIRFDLSQLDDGTYDFGLYDRDSMLCSKSIQKETKAHTFVLLDPLLEKQEALTTLSWNDLD